MSLDLLVDSGEADPAAVFALMEDPPRASAELGDGGTQRFYVATYRDMIRLQSARDGYARMYRTLADPDARPALVHCTTGKDRTGWAVAALLLFLGVPESDVVDEYMISDLEVRRAFQHVVDDFVARGGSRDVIEPLMSVHPSFLEAALEAMHADYGSIDSYFTDGLGLEAEVLEALRKAFLEAPDEGAQTGHAEHIAADQPAFFFPGAGTAEQGEQYREAVVRFARDNGFPASPRRIFRLAHSVDGVDRTDEVGQLESQDGHEVVVAILEAGKLFCVVTASRGFQRGTPIPYHRDEVTEVVDFATPAEPS